MDLGSGQEPVKPVSLSRKMSKVGLLAAMKTFTKPHFQRKKKSKDPGAGGVKHQQSRSWDSGLCNLGVTSPGAGLGTVGSYKRIYWPGFVSFLLFLPSSFSSYLLFFYIIFPN